MKFSMTGQEKGDLIIQVTAWASLTIYIYIYIYINFMCIICIQAE